jgi:hypothetical protein
MSTFSEPQEAQQLIVLHKTKQFSLNLTRIPTIDLPQQ